MVPGTAYLGTGNSSIFAQDTRYHPPEYRVSVKLSCPPTLPETGNQYFYVYTDIIKSQYHGDVVVPVLRTVTVKGEHGKYISKNFERPHYVPLKKKNL